MTPQRDPEPAVPDPLYPEDLAVIQHEGFGEFSRRAAPGILRLLRDARRAGGVVVDLGCGDGAWLRRLAQAGFDAIGVDASPALVAIARREAPRAEVQIGSLHDFAIPPCVAVTALGEVLGYASPTGRVRSLDRLFARVAAALPRGGRFVFDAIVDGAGKPMTYRTWSSGKRWAVLVEVEESRTGSRLTRDITTFRRLADGTYRRGHVQHRLQVLDRAETTARLREAGFSVRVSRRYGDFVLPPRRVAFLARKR